MIYESLEKLLAEYPDRNDMSFEEELSFVQDCFDTYEAIGFAETFHTPYTEGTEHKYNGQSFKVIKRCSYTKDDIDITVLPMWLIQFSDGHEAYAYPEEICKTEVQNTSSVSNEVQVYGTISVDADKESPMFIKALFDAFPGMPVTIRQETVKHYSIIGTTKYKEDLVAEALNNITSCTSIKAGCIYYRSCDVSEKEWRFRFTGTKCSEHPIHGNWTKEYRKATVWTSEERR